MNSSLRRVSLCVRHQQKLHPQIPGSHQTLKSISTGSAINKGLRASRPEGNRGGSDRYSAARPSDSSRFANSRSSGFSRDGPGRGRPSSDGDVNGFGGRDRPRRFAPTSRDTGSTTFRGDRDSSKRPSFRSRGADDFDTSDDKSRPAFRFGDTGFGKPRSTFGDRPSARGLSKNARFDKPGRSSFGDRPSTRGPSENAGFDKPRRSSFGDRSGSRGLSDSSDFDKPRRSSFRDQLKNRGRSESHPKDRVGAPGNYGRDQGASHPESLDRYPRNDVLKPNSWNDMSGRSSHDNDAQDPPRKRFGKDEADPDSEKDPSYKKSLKFYIKQACRGVVKMRKTGSVEPVAGIRSCLANVYSYLKSGDVFERDDTDVGDDPLKKVTTLFFQKGQDGIFSKTMPDEDAETTLYLKDGTFRLFIGHGDAAKSKVDQQKTDGQEKDPRNTHQRETNSGSGKPQATRGTWEKDENARDGMPVSVPYTTAASQFLYGYNSVLAAMKAGRRKMYRLYVHPKIFERESDSEATGPKSSHRPAQEFVSLAKAANIPFRNEFDTRLLSKMSEDRPHNGIVLEASRLPVPPVVNLGKAEPRRGVIPITLGQQSAEDAAVNGTPSTISTVSKTWRYPLVVLLDGITDPGNLGNIIRTCHFYGVDAIAVAVNTCANLSLGSVAKASSGACEAVNLLAISQPSNFIFESAQYRWKIYASVAPSPNPSDPTKHITTADMAKDSPLAKHPCILMLGSEGQGLRTNLKNRADKFVSIGRGTRPDGSPDVGVDSMNVSVAAGVLLESFLRKPDSAPEIMDVANELGF